MREPTWCFLCLLAILYVLLSQVAKFPDDLLEPLSLDVFLIGMLFMLKFVCTYVPVIWSEVWLSEECGD